jgi:endonuclease/exonuclease/phosphatase family metal-dependent hydrolase
MSRAIKGILRIILYFFLFIIIGIAGFFLFATITDYKPKDTEILQLEGRGRYIDTARTFTFLSWNIGYAALGKEMDFFYDGGTTVRPPDNLFEKYFDGIKKTIVSLDTIDFYLFQELDINANRSYNKNQLTAIAKLLPYCTYSFALNYNVKYIPFPLGNPMGKVKSGLTSFSIYKPANTVRYAFDANFSWPKSIFFLDRCFLLNRYELDRNEELVVINVHNSAFDTENKLKSKEIDLIKKIILEEYNKGNFVIIGGDWNQNPPGFDSSVIKGYTARNIAPSINENILPQGWQWVFQSSVPTNRDVDKAYNNGTTKTSIIDFFLLSPNIELLENKTIDNGFEYSDHQPVYIKIRLNCN